MRGRIPPFRLLGGSIKRDGLAVTSLNPGAQDGRSPRVQSPLEGAKHPCLTDFEAYRPGLKNHRAERIPGLPVWTRIDAGERARPLIVAFRDSHHEPESVRALAQLPCQMPEMS